MCKKSRFEGDGRGGGNGDWLKGIKWNEEKKRRNWKKITEGGRKCI